MGKPPGRHGARVSAQALLSKLAPKKYGDLLRMEHSGSVRTRARTVAGQIEAPPLI